MSQKQQRTDYYLSLGQSQTRKTSSMCRWAVCFPLFLLWRQLHRNHITIFFAHGVTDSRLPSSWSPLRGQLAADYLDRGLTVLARYYRFLSLDQAIEMLAGRQPMQPHGMVLTFDDGYRNNFSHALPILRRHGVPAVFYIATGHIDRREPFWYDRLDYALQHLTREQAISFCGQLFLFYPGNEHSLHATFAALRATIKADHRDYRETMKDVDTIAQTLENNAGCRLADCFEQDHYTSVMSWDEVRRASREGITIGSHTVDHVLLDRLSPPAAMEQLTGSKQRIETQTGMECRHLCYPNGNWNESVANLTRGCGYQSAVTIQHGFSTAGESLFSLQRMSFLDTPDTNALLFRASGLR